MTSKLSQADQRYLWKAERARKEKEAQEQQSEKSTDEQNRR
jgi:hypothetical protein